MRKYAYTVLGALIYSVAFCSNSNASTAILPVSLEILPAGKIAKGMGRVALRNRQQIVEYHSPNWKHVRASKANRAANPAASQIWPN